MTAATQDRARREERWTYHLMPIAAIKVMRGWAACFDLNTGYVITPVAGGGDEANLKFIGFFAEDYDNSAGVAGYLVNVNFVRERVLVWHSNDTAHPVTASMLGQPAYVLDNQTVTALGTSESVAGTIWAVDPLKGVLIEV
jgi:hypothetical protein